MRLRIFAALAAFLVLCAPALATSYVVLPDGTSFPVLAPGGYAPLMATESLGGAQPTGSGSFASPAPVTVGTSATLIVAARTGGAGTGRIAVTITCAAAAAVGPTSAVTFAGAGQIPAGGALTLNTTAAVYGIVGSGSTTCNAWETF